MDHTKGGLWPSEGSCYFTGHWQSGKHTRRDTEKAVSGHRSSHVIQKATGKAVYREGGTGKTRSVATAGFMLLKEL